MKKDNSKLILVIGIIVALIVITIGVGIILYFCTDIFKTEQQMFYKYLAQTENILQFIPEKNEQGDGITKGTVTMDLTSTDQEVANQTIPPRNFSLEYTVNRNSTEDKSSMQATLKYVDTDLFTLKYLRNQDTYALKSDEVINKYIGFENNDLKAFAARFGIADTSNIPDKIDPVDYKPIFQLTDEQKQYLKDTYFPIIAESISEELYSKGEENITVEDTQMSTKTYSVNLTTTQIINTIINMLEKAKEDNTLLQIIIDKYSIIDPESELTTEQLQEDIQDMLDDMNVEDIEEESIKITLYVNEKKLVRIDFSNDEGNIYVDFIGNAESNKIIIVNNLPLSEDNNITRIEILNEKYLYSVDTVVTINANNAGKEITLSIQTTTETEQDSINKTVIFNVNIDDTTYFTLNVNENTVFQEDVEIETLNDANCAKINNFTPEYAQQIFTGIGNRLQQLLQEKILLVMQTEMQGQQAGISGTNGTTNENL